MGKDIIQTQVCCPDDLPDEIRQKLISSTEHICIAENSIYVLIEDNVVCFPNNSAGNTLANAVSRKQKDSLSIPQNKEEMYKRILDDPDYQPNTTILRQYGIKKDITRCVAVFRSFSPIETDLYSILSSMAPAEEGDAIIPAGYQTAVFVKDPDGQTEDEIIDYIDAVIGTLEAEGIIDIRAGIGRIYPDVTGIRQSCEEGFQALRLGKRYHGQDHVYAYSKQTLERIVDSIPAEKKAEIRNMFIGSKSENTLSDELLETVRIFFQNDLNLTAASKQLFIHRNTLNYRLDKIKKVFGLDLRTFQDAVIFRIITEIANEF